MRFLPFLFLLSSFAFGQNLPLTAVQFPESVTVKVPFSATDRVPEADFSVKVKFNEAQAHIALECNGLKSPLLFGGDVSAYVLWAVMPDGRVENLGEIRVEEGKASGEYTTGQKNFAMIITAESYYLVTRPSSLVAYISQPVKKKRAANASFNFSGLLPPPDHNLETIKTYIYSDKTPLDLVQADRVYHVAEKEEATKYTPDTLSQAHFKLTQARNLARGSKKAMRDYARRSIALSVEAIETTRRMKAAEKIKKEIAERKKERDALMGQLEESRKAQEQVAASLKDLNGEKTKLEGERAALTAANAEALAAQKAMEVKMATAKEAMSGLETQRDQLQSTVDQLESSRNAMQEQIKALDEEKEKLSQRLEGALSTVAQTRETAQSYIVSLSDILFDVDKATLKSDTRVTLAKLAGILLIMKEIHLRVEGHTDNQGSEKHNLKLSQERAQSVLDFLGSQGVTEERMTAKGFGFSRPIADNTTKEGRAKNRRVEIILIKTAASATP